MYDKKTISHFRRKLLNWYRLYHRDLPWRKSTNPYWVWISEIMLQQTQVRTVLPYYERFLNRFPDVESLAVAEEAEVLQLWSGLGYYSRAKNILKAARKIRDTYGHFPEDFSQVMALPGIGRYTAGAICSIAFNQPLPIVDGNIRRVLTRLHGITGKVAERHFWDTMSELVPHSNPSSFNQAMMELGALVCTPSQPGCSDCPVLAFCRAREMGIQTSVPGVWKNQKSRKVTIVLVVLEWAGKILVSAASKDRLIPGSWAIPWQRLGKAEVAEIAALSICEGIVGAAVPLRPLRSLRHSITTNQITGLVYSGVIHASDLGTMLSSPDTYRWVAKSEALKLLTSSLFHKALKTDDM